MATKSVTKRATKTAKKAKTAPAAKVATAKADAGAKRLAGRIHLLVKDNPHREGSGRFKRWRLYREGMSVGDALKAGLNSGNLYHSVKDGHIKIG
jgi:hypothetical protein